MKKEYKFDKVLYYLLAKHHMTQMAFADSIYVTQGMVWKWLKKGVMPNLDNLILISELFDVSIDYLVFGDEAVE